jgi:hypothetical protein
VFHTAAVAAALRLRPAVLVVLALIAAPASGDAQKAMLEPPTSQYFVGRGTWGQSYPDQWALQRIGFDASPQSAWRLVRRDAQPVVVAVIDTGLDWNHRNISRDNLWRNPKETPDNGIDDDKNGYVDDVIGWDFFDRDNRPWDYDGHGTFVAGIIAARWDDKAGMAGVNPFARLMILKAINNFGHTRASFVAQAIAYAADNGARVINLSVGGKEISPVEMAAIDYAHSKGAVLVAAAGKDERTVFSNWGNVSVAAPGLDVLSLRARRTDTMLGIQDVKYEARAAYVGDDRRYYRASGTSFSAPLVAGLASLMIANDPGLTNEQVMRIIKSTARDVETPGVDQYTGYGIVDARAALRAPREYVHLAGINRVEVVKQGGGQAVRVRGTADANALRALRLEIGAGETPTTWRAVGKAQRAAGPDDVLGDIPASAFAGAKVWQVRVVVTHQNGAVREARFRLSLG